MAITLVVALLVALMTIVIRPVDAFSTAPEFTLDLSKPPIHRWDGAVKAVLKVHPWEYSFGPLFDFYLAEWDKAAINYPMIAPMLHDLVRDRYPDIYGELQGIQAQFAAVGHGNITMAKLAPFFYFYEAAHMGIFYGAYTPAPQPPTLAPFDRFGASSGSTPSSSSALYRKQCTAILTLPEDPSKPILHGRNMDEAPLQGRNITLDITVVRNSSSGVLYQVFDFAWFSGGFATSMRKGVLTMQHNWRDTNDGAYNTTQVLARVLDNRTVPALFVQRHLMEQEDMTFDKAIHFMNSSLFAAPLYEIMSGAGRVGAVASIYGVDPHPQVFNFISDEGTNSTWTRHADKSAWFLVQTNYDHWKPDPPQDPRRTVAQDALTRVGRTHGSADVGVWMALSTYPVHNRHTMYSALLSIDKNEPFGFVRVPMFPNDQ